MEIEFWYWLVFGVALLILEVFAPGAAFLWLGLAAGVTGGVLWLRPSLDWEYQLLVFASLSLISVLLAWRYFRNRPIETTNPNLNAPGVEHIGRTYKLAKAVENGVGHVRLGDGLWRVRCDVDLREGARVRVTGVDGATLLIEPAVESDQPPAIA